MSPTAQLVKETICFPYTRWHDQGFFKASDVVAQVDGMALDKKLQRVLRELMDDGCICRTGIATYAIVRV